MIDCRVDVDFFQILFLVVGCWMCSSGLGIFSGSILMTEFCGDLMGR